MLAMKTNKNTFWQWLINLTIIYICEACQAEYDILQNYERFIWFWRMIPCLVLSFRQNTNKYYRHPPVVRTEKSATLID